MDFNVYATNCLLFTEVFLSNELSCDQKALHWWTSMQAIRMMVSTGILLFYAEWRVWY